MTKEQFVVDGGKLKDKIRELIPESSYANQINVTPKMLCDLVDEYPVDIQPPVEDPEPRRRARIEAAIRALNAEPPPEELSHLPWSWRESDANLLRWAMKQKQSKRLRWEDKDFGL